MTKLSERIIAKIKCERIAPVPRWRFLLKNYVIWTLFVVSVILGSLSFGVIEHIFESGDFDILNHMQGSWLTSTVMLLPYFWLAFLLFFAMVAYYNWKHTKLGYLFKRRWIFLGSLVLSFILGNIFYAAGFGKKIDLLMVKMAPFYNESKHDARIKLWQQPEKGLLIGIVVEINDDRNVFVVEDRMGIRWFVQTQLCNKTKAQLMEIVKKGAIVKIVGNKSSENNFIAKDIRNCSDCDGGSDDYGK